METALLKAHQTLNALMVDFHGWQMPMHYGSQLAEHRAVRESVGLFDVSHMTQVDVTGAQAGAFLRRLLANDVAKISSGQALYSLMLNESGGILDDLIVYCVDSTSYRLVLNSATKALDLAWIQQQQAGFDVEILILDQAMLALQGPQALTTLATCFSAQTHAKIKALAPFSWLEVDGIWIATTGYTGEQGVELMMSNAQAQTFWQQLIEAGVQPCGLGARDTLRLEAGMHLYGQDMSAETHPLNSSLGWSVVWEPEDRGFIGQSALALLRERGVDEQLTGLVLSERGVLRPGMKLFWLDDASGQNNQSLMTSGTFSPTLGHSIGWARLPKQLPSEVFVEIRGQALQVQLTTLKFVKHGQAVYKYKKS
jgi:aminomethyltransferase